MPLVNICEPDQSRFTKRFLTDYYLHPPNQINGKATFGRNYSWGTLDIMDSNHSDFLHLRSMVIGHMQDLREVTNELLYENFRSARLANGLNGYNNFNDSGSVSNSIYETDKDRQLREKEEEIKRMQEMLKKLQSENELKLKPVETQH